MKMAKVVSVRDISAEEKHPELRHAARRQRIEALLRRYPQIRDSETEEIVRFLATGPHRDVGLVAGSEEFADKVRSLRKTNKKHFKLKPHEAILFFVAVVGPAAAFGLQHMLG